MKKILAFLLASALLLSACNARQPSDFNSSSSASSKPSQGSSSDGIRPQNHAVKSDVSNSAVEEIKMDSSTDYQYFVTAIDSENDKITLEYRDITTVNDVAKYLNDVEKYYYKVSPPSQHLVVRVAAPDRDFTYMVWIDTKSETSVKVADDDFNIWSINHDSSEAIKKLFSSVADMSQYDTRTFLIQVSSSSDDAVLWNTSDREAVYQLDFYLNDVHEAPRKAGPPNNYYNVLIVNPDASSEYRVWLNPDDDHSVLVADASWNIWSIGSDSSAEVKKILGEVL